MDWKLGKVAALLLLSSAQVAAHDGCDYAALPGAEFEFSLRDPELRQYGYQMFSETTEPGQSLPYESYVGKKGKFVGTISDGPAGVIRMRDIVLDDCKRVYYMALKENLADENIEFHGVKFLTKPARKWSAQVKVDAMTDAKSCMVTPESETPFPMFLYHAKGGTVTAGMVGGDFPGKEVSFRVDKLPAVSEREQLGPANAQKLIQQIRAGGKALLTRSYKWPDDVPNTKEFDLDGLVAALDECKAALK